MSCVVLQLTRSSLVQNSTAIVATRVSATTVLASGDKFVLRELDGGNSTSTSAIFKIDSNMLDFTCIACVVTRYEKFFNTSKHAIWKNRKDRIPFSSVEI